MVEDNCKRLIKEHIRQSASVNIGDLEDELADLLEQRERMKVMMRKGLLDIDEGESDMKELNESIGRISSIISEQDVTEALTRRVKENLAEFLTNFDAFSYKDGLSNNALKAVVKEIRVIGKADLHVYFNVDNSVEGLFFPIKIEGSQMKADTKSSDRT
jgi:uncharacterized protein with ATP-grasp and redox domains